MERSNVGGAGAGAGGAAGTHVLPDPLVFMVSRQHSREKDALYMDSFVQLSTAEDGIRTVEDLWKYVGKGNEVNADNLFTRCGMNDDAGARPTLSLPGDPEAIRAHISRTRLVKDEAEIAKHSHGDRPHHILLSFAVMGLHYFSTRHGRAPDTDNPSVTGRLMLKAWSITNNPMKPWCAAWEALVLGTLATGEFEDEVIGASWTDITKIQTGATVRYSITLWLGPAADRARPNALWGRINDVVCANDGGVRWPRGMGHTFKWK